MSHFNIARGHEIPGGSAAKCGGVTPNLANARSTHRKKCVVRDTWKKDGARYPASAKIVFSFSGRRSDAAKRSARRAQSHSPSAGCRECETRRRRRRRCNNARAEGGAASGVWPRNQPESRRRNATGITAAPTTMSTTIQKGQDCNVQRRESILRAAWGIMWRWRRPTPPRPLPDHAPFLQTPCLHSTPLPSVQFSRTTKGTHTHFG